jgi:hypothetical protein
MVRSFSLCFRRRKLRPRRTTDLIGRHPRAASTTTTGPIGTGPLTEPDRWRELPVLEQVLQLVAHIAEYQFLVHFVERQHL